MGGNSSGGSKRLAGTSEHLKSLRDCVSGSGSCSFIDQRPGIKSTCSQRLGVLARQCSLRTDEHVAAAKALMTSIWLEDRKRSATPAVQAIVP